MKSDFALILDERGKVALTDAQCEQIRDAVLSESLTDEQIGHRVRLAQAESLMRASGLVENGDGTWSSPST